MIFRFGHFQADTINKVLRSNGEPVALTPKAFDTLAVLLENAGTLVEKDRLMEAVWQDRFVEESNLTFNIRVLRKTLGDDASAPTYIETVPRRGYRFIATLATDDAIPADAETPVIPVRRRRFPAIMAAAAIVVLGLAGFALYKSRFVDRQHFERSRMTRVTTSGKAVLAVVSPDGKYVVHAEDHGGTQNLLLRQTGEARDIEILPRAPGQFLGFTVSPDSRSIYYTFLEANRSDSALYQIPILGGASREIVRDLSSGVSFSPDGSRIAYYRTSPSRGVSELYIAAPDGSDERLIVSRQAPDTFETNFGQPVWLPDGKTIIAIGASTQPGHKNRLIEISVVDGSIGPLADTKWDEIYQICPMTGTNGLLMVVFDNDANASQIFYFDPRSGETRKVSDDLNSYQGLSVSNDGQVVLSTRTEQITKLSVTGNGTTREIVSETGMLSGKEGFAWTRDDRLVFRLENLGMNDLWISDLAEKRRLTFDSRSNRHPTVCENGETIVYAANENGLLRLWKMSVEGKDQEILIPGGSESEMFPSCSQNGEWVVYQRGWRQPTAWKVPVRGGTPVQLTQRLALRPAISPDGTKIAFYQIDQGIWKIVIIDSDGTLIRSFATPQSVRSRILKWTPDGKSVSYADTNAGVSNVWVQPIDGSEPRRVTNFDSEEIFYFDWAPSGRFVAYYRGTISNDVVAIEKADQ